MVDVRVSVCLCVRVACMRALLACLGEINIIWEQPPSRDLRRWITWTAGRWCTGILDVRVRACRGRVSVGYSSVCVFLCVVCACVCAWRACLFCGVMHRKHRHQSAVAFLRGELRCAVRTCEKVVFLIMIIISVLLLRPSTPMMRTHRRVPRSLRGATEQTEQRPPAPASAPSI